MTSTTTPSETRIRVFGGSFQRHPATLPPPPSQCSLAGQYMRDAAHTIQKHLESGKEFYPRPLKEYNCFRITGIAPASSKDQLAAKVFRALPESQNEAEWESKIGVMSEAYKNPSVRAVSFVPTHPSDRQTWLLELNPEEEEGCSFLPPFPGYSKGDSEYPAPSLSPSSGMLFSSQTLEENISQSVQEIPEGLQETTGKILRYFTSDTKTRALAITFCDDTGNLARRVVVKTPTSLS